MLNGLIEVISPNFITGWALSVDQTPVHVYASLDDKIIGWARADIDRSDLMAQPSDDPASAPAVSAEQGRCFIIVFDKAVAPESLSEIKVTVLEIAAKLRHANGVRYDRPDPLQIFILGSPRSGTSALAETLVRVFDLRWHGAAHTAPSFQEAAAALNGSKGPITSPIVDFMKRSSLGTVVERAMRQTYYWMHSSSSFLDKTPGLPMIQAAPFLAACFPNARFIFLRRNGISNVLSRMEKFDESFRDHCADWEGAMTAWQEARASVPYYLEIDQETMLDQPKLIAKKVAGLLGRPRAEAEIAASLEAAAPERTGAGIGRTTLASTGWTEKEIEIFREVCTPAMEANGYAVE